MRSISQFVPGGNDELSRIIGPQNTDYKVKEFKNRNF